MVINKPENRVRITFMGQAGFIFEAGDGTSVGVDLYLSDACYRYFGFKRLMPYIADAGSLDLDFIVSTHAHFDHFDPDSVPVLLSNSKTRMIAACDVKAEAERLGLDESKISYVKVGDSVEAGSVRLEAIECDHGEGTPDAVGILLEMDGKRIVIAGDTCFHEEYFSSEKVRGADILILPINGAYGNLNEIEAVKAVSIAKPTLAIPCHYWNFAEHGGDPEKFASEMQEKIPEVPYLLMRPGETFEI